MRSSKKKKSRRTIAIMVGAILLVQIAIFFVIRTPRDEGEKAKDTTGQGSASRESASDNNALAAAKLGDAAAVKAGTDEAPALEPKTLPTATAVADAVVEEPAAADEPPALALVETRPDSAESRTKKPKAKVVAGRSGETIRGRNVSKPDPKPVAPEPAPVKAAPTMATVSILTSPSGATVALDGVFVGKSPLNNIDVAPGRHSVALSYSGFEPKVVRIRAVTGELAKISETLSKIVVKTNTSEPTAPTAVVATRLPATPRVATSKEGNADTGKSLLGSGCNACHSENGTSSIGPRRFTSAQWDRFFARGSHDRYQRIGGAMSSSQMAHVKTYLKSKAADAVRNQGAGIR